MTTTLYIPVPTTAQVIAFSEEEAVDFIHLWVRKELADLHWQVATNAFFDFDKKMQQIKIAISAAYN